MATETLKPSTQPIPDPPAATDRDDQKVADKDSFEDRLKAKVNELVRLVNGIDKRVETLETLPDRSMGARQHRMLLIGQITSIETHLHGNVYSQPTPQHALLARLKRELEFAYTEK